MCKHISNKRQVSATKPLTVKPIQLQNVGKRHEETPNQEDYKHGKSTRLYSL